MKLVMLATFMILSALPWDLIYGHGSAHPSYHSFYTPTYPCIIMEVPHGKFIMTEPGCITFYHKGAD